MAKLEKISMKNADAPKLKTLLTDIGRESKALRRVMTRLQIRDVLQVFKRWTDQTVAEKQMQASSFKAVHRLNAAKIWHSFYIWLEHAAEELTKLKIITIVRRLLVKRLLSRALHQSFDLWLFHIFETQQHTAEALKELSRKIHFAAKLVKVRSNATCLQALRLWYEHTKSKLLSSAELVNRWTNNTQALAWGKWRGQVRRSRVAKKLVMWWIEKKLFAAWKTWERQVEKKHRCKLLARAADKIEVRCNKVHLAKVVAWWKDNIKKLRHKEKALEKMVLRMQSVGMCKAFALWIDNATKLRRLWSLLQKMSLRMRSAGMCKGWVRWEEQWRQGKKMRRSAEKVIKRWQNTSLAPAFLALMESAKELKGMRNARARVMLRWQRLGLSTGFYRWREHVENQRQMASAAEKIVLRRRHHAISPAMSQWTQYVSDRTRMARSAERAVRRMQKMNVGMG